MATTVYKAPGVSRDILTFDHLMEFTCDVNLYLSFQFFQRNISNFKAILLIVEYDSIISLIKIILKIM